MKSHPAPERSGPIPFLTAPGRGVHDLLSTGLSIVILPVRRHTAFQDGMEAELVKKAKKRAQNPEEAKTHVGDLSAAEARRLYSICVELLESCSHVSSICVELLELCPHVSRKVDPEAGYIVAPVRDLGFEVRSNNQAGNARVSSTGGWRCSAS
jgi:hypothetical protein